MAEGEHPNCQAVETFLNQLGDGISRPIVKSEQINGSPVHDCYTASYMDNAKGIGFTVLAFADGNFKVIVEMGGGIDRAASDGLRTKQIFEKT